MIDYYAPNIDLTLLGCGLLANYHLGAIYLLNQVWPHKPFNRICGASSGGIIAALMVSGASFEQVAAGFMNLVKQLRDSLRKPFQRGFQGVHKYLDAWLQSILPQNAHKLCTDRCGISITRLSPLKNIVAHQFESRQDLIDAILAGCFIPVWSGGLVVPKYKGHKCIDGGYSNNVPSLPDSDHVSYDQYDLDKNGIQAIESSPAPRRLQVCAFASDCDISPSCRRDNLSYKCFGTTYYFNWKGIVRVMRTLTPLDDEVYLQDFFDGHRDMKNFILSNDMIRCQQCTWSKQPPSSQRWSCLSCLRLMEKIDSLKVPRNLIRIYDKKKYFSTE